MLRHKVCQAPHRIRLQTRSAARCQPCQQNVSTKLGALSMRQMRSVAPRLRQSPNPKQTMPSMHGNGWQIQRSLSKPRRRSKKSQHLARRTRCLFLDAFETEKIAPQVVSIMAKNLDLNKSWEENELSRFNTLIKKYQL